MRSTTLLLCAAFAAAFLPGCASRAPAETVAAESAGPYRLGSGDRLRLTVFGQPDMTGEYAVDGDGKISVPLAGQIEAKDLTASELEGRIRDKLTRSDVLVNPSVSVQVLTARPFYILGEVRQPGQFPYVDGMTVVTAAAIAGGFTYRADEDDFTVTRREGDQVTEEEVSRNAPVKPGDVITVHERMF